MTLQASPSVEARWSRLGGFIPVSPCTSEPDVERLLLDTARAIPSNPRLLQLAATWLRVYGTCVAKHRLKRLVVAELDPDSKATIGLLLETAMELGATRDLAIAVASCEARTPPRPLFDVSRTAAELTTLAERTASPIARRWGAWAPPTPLNLALLRPTSWILAHNPGLYERLVRKGDLRCSILESLHRDARGVAKSESALAELSGATRAAVRKALHSLSLEGRVTVTPGNSRDHRVTLTSVAAWAAEAGPHLNETPPLDAWSSGGD